MSKLVEIARIQSKASYALPASYAREIGRVVVRWAFFERQVQQMIWAVAFDGDDRGAALGRLAIMEPKFPDRLTLLANLAKVRKIKFDERLLSSMKSRSKSLNEERNLMAHGTWTKVPGYGWLVQQTRGPWDSSAFGEDGPSGPRKITPEALPRSPEEVMETVTALEGLIEDARKLQTSLERVP